MTHQSNVPYEPVRIHAAAIYCSDGRFGEQFDDFLMNVLKLPRYDRLAVPGGPACLAGHPVAFLEEKGVVNQLKFLVEVHGLTRIVMIAHQGCAFYGTKLKLLEPRLEQQQRTDLIKAADYVRRMTRIEAIELYFARVVGETVRFESVPLR